MESIFILLAQEKVLEWPKLGIGGVIIILLFFLAGAGLSYFFGKTTRSKQEKSKYWNIILHYSLKHGLDAQEIAIIKTFFTSLSRDKQEELASSMSKKMLHFLLLQYLRKFRSDHPKANVSILARLFIPGNMLHEKLSSIQDLYPGEACNILYNQKEFMCTVMKTVQNEVLLAHPDLNPTGLKAKEQIELYIFRPEFGSFTFHGEVKAIGKDTLIFQHTGALDYKNTQKLMAQIALKLVLTAFPEPYYYKSILAEKQREAKKNKVTPEKKGHYIEELQLDGSVKKTFIPDREEASEERPIEPELMLNVKPLVIRGVTTKVSIRGLVFNPAEEPDSRDVNSQELWELELELDETHKIRCIGKLIFNSGTYLFRYSNFNDRDRDRLERVIMKNDPVKEQLS